MEPDPDHTGVGKRLLQTEWCLFPRPSLLQGAAFFVQATMLIHLNEQPYRADSPCSLFALREAEYPAADILIVNGHPCTGDCELRAGDRVVMIQRGVQPDADEIEALLTARHSPGVHARLKTGRVAVAGVGGLGSTVAVALARAGVGELILIDHDVVEPSNLNRQQFFIDQIGLPKVTALAATLTRINPGTRVRAYWEKVREDNLERLFDDCDILVEAFDDAAQKALLVNAFLQRYPQRCVVAASGMAGHGPSNSIRTHRLGQRLYLCGDLHSEARPGQGLIAPRVGLAAHHQANTVVRLLLGETALDTAQDREVIHITRDSPDD